MFPSREVKKHQNIPPFSNDNPASGIPLNAVPCKCRLMPSNRRDIRAVNSEADPFPGWCRFKQVAKG